MMSSSTKDYLGDRDNDQLPEIANVYVAISGYRSLLQSHRVSFCELGVVENPRFTVGIVILSVIVLEILVFPVLVATLPFPVVGRCRSRPGLVSSLWAWSTTPCLPSELP